MYLKNLYEDIIKQDSNKGTFRLFVLRTFRSISLLIVFCCYFLFFNREISM